MNFLADAQLPRRLALWLNSEGHNTIHTFELPKNNRTSDGEICVVADREKRAVITKDDDFVYSFMTQAQPERLLLVGTGNISNNDLLDLFRDRTPEIERAFSECRLVELTRESVISHE